MKKYALFFTLAILSLVTFSQAFFALTKAEENHAAPLAEPVTLKMEHVPVAISTPTAAPTPVIADPSVSNEEVELLALLTMAEAEGECEEEQRLVIDTVLNRIDDPHFPDNIYDVVYQRNQYAGMQEPRITRCYVKDELVQLVREELENRTNYGVPMFQIDHHYFSSYD